MKRSTLLSLILAPVALADGVLSTLSFADETSIIGTPLSTDGKEKLMKFVSPSLDGEFLLKTDQLLEMELDTKGIDSKADHYALATIEPRHDKSPPLDRIRGRLLHLDDDSLTLETAYAGNLTLKRSMVSALDIYSESPNFYNGPTGPEGWVASSGEVEESWTFRDRAMISKGTTGIARQVNFPDRSVIKFTVGWKTSPSFKILFLSNTGDTENPSAAFNLSVRSSYVSLYHSAGLQRRNLFSESTNSLQSVQEAEISIYLDKAEDGASALYIGGERVGSWSGVDASADMGDWLHFVPQRNDIMRFSNISVAQWDGNLPDAKSTQEKTSDDEFGDNLTGQKITLANGDSVIGEIKTIENDFVQASTEFGDVRIPLNRMSSIDLSDLEFDEEGKVIGSKKEEPRMWEQDIRAWFHDGGSITIRLDSIEDGKIKGYSQVFGDAEFDINAFSRLEFNVWDRKLDPARYGLNDNW